MARIATSRRSARSARRWAASATSPAHPAGSSDLPPPRCGISISDDLAGLYAAIGLLSALWQRDAAGTGRGRVVDVNLVDSVFSLMEGMLPEYAMDGRVRQPVGAAIETAAPTNTYPCADGKWLCIAGNSDLIFARLMAAIGRPELASRPGLCDQRRSLCAPRRRWTRRLPPGHGRCRRGRPRRGWRRRTCRARACSTSPIAPTIRISERAARCRK